MASRAKPGTTPASAIPDPVVPDDPPETRAGVLAWAARWGVDRLLDAKVSVLQREDPSLPVFGYDYLVALVDLFSPPLMPRFARVQEDLVVPRTRAAARVYLKAAAVERLAERAQRDAFLARATTPKEPAVIAFDARLGLVAEQLGRGGTYQPKGVVGYPADEPTLLSGDAPMLVVRLGSAWVGVPPVRLPLPALNASPAEGVAAMERENRLVGTSAQVFALEVARDLLRDPASAVGVALRGWLSMPRWQRVLDRLERAKSLEPPLPTKAPARLAFRLGLDEGGLPAVEPLVQSSRKNGSFTMGRLVALRDAAAVATTTVETRVLDGLVAVAASRGRALDEAVGRRIVALMTALADHPRVFLAGESARPVRIRRGRLTISLAATEGGHVVELSVAGRARSPAALHATRLPEGTVIDVDLATGTVTLLPLDGIAFALVATLAEAPTAFPPEAIDPLLGALLSAQDGAELSLPDALLGQVVDADARPVVRLVPLSADSLQLTLGVRPLASGPLLEPGSGQERALGARDGLRVSAHRLLEQEREQAEHLLASLPLGAAVREGPWVLRIDDPDRAADVIVALGERADEVVVEWPEGPAPRVTTVSRRDLRLRIERRRDWFGVEGEVDADGTRVPLAALLLAARAGHRFVRLGPDRIVALARDLRERLAAADDRLAEGAKGEIEAHPVALRALDELVEDERQITAVKEWATIRTRMRKADGHDAKLPPGLLTELRGYQVDGFRWMARLADWGEGACLADDMGLGKTIQALALLLHRAKEGPALVVAPTTVGPNWIAEAARFAPSLRLTQHRGIGRRERLASLGPGDVLVVSYDIMARDADALGERVFATLVLDEAQSFKNAASRRAAAARGLRASFRVALSGTPIENHLGELWSLFRVVSPRLLGKWDRFRERFARPIERDRDPARSAALAALIRPFLLRRTKASVAPELPARTETVRFVELSPAERALYEAERLAAVTSVTELDPTKGRFAVLAALTRLRRLACHPRLSDPASTVPSSKLVAFLEIEDELRAAGHRALVFSQFTSHLALVREALDQRGVRYLYLDGSTPSAERQRLVAAFQAGEGDLFLLSLKAGGTGINLTGADYVVHLDPWWNPAAEDQATDRTHRIGQTRPVTVVRLVAKATIEEAVLALHGEKRELAESLLAGGEVAGSLSSAELVDLVRKGQDAAREAEES